MSLRNHSIFHCLNRSRYKWNRSSHTEVLQKKIWKILKISKENPCPSITSQQTFVLMKTSFVFVFGRRLDQDEYVRLSLTSSEDVFKTSSRRFGQDQYIRLGYTSSRRLQDVFKTSSRRLAKTSSRHLQDVFKTFQEVFKTSSRHLEKRLQDIFKTSSRLIIKLNCSF